MVFSPSMPSIMARPGTSTIARLSSNTLISTLLCCRPSASLRPQRVAASCNTGRSNCLMFQPISKSGSWCWMSLIKSVNNAVSFAHQIISKGTSASSSSPIISTTFNVGEAMPMEYKWPCSSHSISKEKAFRSQRYSDGFKRAWTTVLSCCWPTP